MQATIIKWFKTPLSLTLVWAATTNAFAVDAVPDTLTDYAISENLVSTIAEALPETSQVNAAFLNPSYDPNLTFTEDAQVAITFVDEGAGYRNSLGYFNFEQGAFDNLTFGDIDTDNSGIISVFELDAVESVSTGMIFGNFSEAGGGGSLQTGDTAVIGGGTASWDTGDLVIDGGTLFSAGTTTGFFLMANAWNGSGVTGWDTAGDPNTFYTLDFLNPENGADATLSSADDDSRHVAMLFAAEDAEQVIVGFEDLVRPGGDNDFNDAVFIIHSDPFSAIADNKLPLAAAPAPALGQGVLALVALALGLPWLSGRLSFSI